MAKITFIEDREILVTGSDFSSGFVIFEKY